MLVQYWVAQRTSLLPHLPAVRLGATFTLPSTLKLWSEWPSTAACASFYFIYFHLFLKAHWWCVRPLSCVITSSSLVVLSSTQLCCFFLLAAILSFPVTLLCFSNYSSLIDQNFSLSWERESVSTRVLHVKAMFLMKAFITRCWQANLLTCRSGSCSSRWHIILTKDHEACAASTTKGL